ncbi:MAG: HD domain-containing protein, partial [Actinomycetota bacterium]
MTEFDQAPWRRLRTPGEVAEAIIDLYRRRGNERYDEVVTQTEHALQTGSCAMAAGADDAAVAAAFLHDVGHLLMAEAELTAAARGVDLHHEAVGARFLATWFGPQVTAPVAHHVAAKRYLCATDADYHATLSPASVTSLELQGGPMSNQEVVAFTAVAGFTTAVDLRRWDDRAKVPDAPTASLD